MVGDLLAMHPCGRREREIQGRVAGQEIGPCLEKAHDLVLRDRPALARPIVAAPGRHATDGLAFPAVPKGQSISGSLLDQVHPTVEQSRAARPRRVSVLLPYPFPGPFDYRIEGEAPALGDLVLVPLNRRAELGVVWEPDGTPPVAENRLKPVAARLDVPPLPPDLRRFVDWLARYTLSPPGLVLAMVLRVDPTPPRPQPGWRPSASPPPDQPRSTPARTRVLQALEERSPQSTADLARAAATSTAVIRAMADAGLLQPDHLPHPTPPRPDHAHTTPSLSPEQTTAAAALEAAVAARRFSTTLLDGVTGSGKTETYLEALAECLRQGRQALVLLPEIALSSQWLARFQRRFGTEPAVWHSEVGAKRRRTVWQAVATGDARIVVGARSALFLPFADLGLVVVDEEHETAFKQEEGVIYHARDMAVVRARLADAPAILVSATPSLETLANVESGRYARLTLTARHAGAHLPQVEAIDMRADRPDRGQFLAATLITAIRDTIAAGEQAMLFLNRRGYAPMTLCRACGHRLACPNCTAWLVEHRARRRLACHHCDHAEPLPDRCPVCAAVGTLAPIGPGIERITEEARAHFPDARLLVMASDTLPGPAAAAAAARAVEAREIDLIIGTQIVAKGWHFPHLTLVGVVDADLGLAGGDLRAAERTVQLLHQVAGRAGRAERPGRVLLQTYAPDHPVMQALIAGDLARFMRIEADSRRPGFWPPYGRLAALIVSADDPADADRTAAELGRTAPTGEGVVVLGPAPAPLAILRGRHRRRLLLRTWRNIPVQPLLAEWLNPIKPGRGVRIDVDVDPVSFL